MDSSDDGSSAGGSGSSDSGGPGNGGEGSEGGTGDFLGGGGSGSSTLDPSAPGALLSSEDVLTQGREIAGLGVPLQLAGLLEALAQLRARSTGSTAALFPAIQGQLSGLRSQYAKASQALARKLGPSGGGYVKQGRGALLNQSSQQYLGLLGQGQQQGFTGLLNTLGNVQPFLSGSARAPNVTAKDSPFNFGAAGQGLASQAQIIGRLLQGNSQSNANNFFGATNYPQSNTEITDDFFVR